MVEERSNANNVLSVRFVSPLVTVPQAALELAVSKDTLWRMVKNNEIPGATRIRGSIRIPRAWVDEKILGVAVKP
jgi:excisionase family DNA binding protein